MARAPLPDGIELEYDTFGDPDDAALLLVSGFGTQLIAWHEAFCRGLAERGRYVVRFDSRDTGLSTKLHDAPVALGAVLQAAMAGDAATLRALAPYTLYDLADDAAALARHVGLERVHVVGASMGGMVAQLVAVRHPSLVATLTSMMASTGASDVGQSTPEAFAALLQPAAPDRAGAIDAAVTSARVWGSKRYFDVDEATVLAQASYDRCWYPEGVARHLAALLATGSIEDQLASLDVPTLVVHGTDDTLITLSGGERTAACIPGARLLVVPDMGHDRPRPLWPLLWDAIAEHTAAH